MNHRDYQKKYSKRKETRSEAIDRYMKLTKKDLAIMLYNLTFCLNKITNEKQPRR